MQSRSLNRAHLLNILLTAGVFLLVGILAPIGGAQAINILREWSMVLDTGSPYPTDSHFYHGGDKMVVTITRVANFDATVESSRLLRKIKIDGAPDDVMEAKVLPLTAIEKGPHGYIIHPTLPDNLPPGSYYYIFPGKFTKYDHVHNVAPRTVEFEIVPKDAPIEEPKDAPASRADLRLNR